MNGVWSYGFVCFAKGLISTRTPQKGRKLPFPEGARCRIVPRAQTPEPADPEAGQGAMSGDSGRRPLTERPPFRSLGPVLCTGRVLVSSCSLAAQGSFGGAGPGGRANIARSRRLQTSMPSRVVICGQLSGAGTRWRLGAPLAWRLWSWLLLPKCSVEHKG